MAFPTLPVLDDFTRADANPLSGGPGWQGPITTGDSQLRIVSNQVLPPTPADDGSSYINTDYGPDIEAYCTLTSAFGATNRIYFYFRCTPGVSFTGYTCRFSNDAGDHHVWLYKDGISFDNFDIANTVASGDKFGVSMIGSTITPYWKAGAGAWTAVGTSVESTYTAAGKLGLRLVTAGLTIDDFGGGTIAPATTTTAWLRA